MKNSILKSGLLISLVLVASTGFSQKKETRDVAEFSGISLGIPAELYLSQGSPQQLVIQASEDELAAIETVVKDGHLKIRTDKIHTKFKDVKIWVTVAEVEELGVSGSGKILAVSALKSDELELHVSGSGKIKMDELSNKEIEVAISGSGSIHLAGTGDEMEVSISGSGSCMAAGFEVDECEVRVSGSGKSEVKATGELEAAISGSGRVIYWGDPEVDARVSGSGKVVSGE